CYTLSCCTRHAAHGMRLRPLTVKHHFYIQLSAVRKESEEFHSSGLAASAQLFQMDGFPRYVFWLPPNRSQGPEHLFFCLKLPHISAEKVHGRAGLYGM